jgi:DNA-binding CsgD family transcriptional regulator
LQVRKWPQAEGEVIMLLDSECLAISSRDLTPPNADRRRAEPWAGDNRFAFLLDQIDYGLLLVADDQAVRYANQAAREALVNEHPLVIRHGSLRALRPQDAAALHKALSASAKGLRSLLLLGTGDRCASVAVVPMHSPNALDRGESLVLFGKRSVWGDLAAQLFARLNGLTNAEEQVLNLLCIGAPPTEAARQLGVAVSTVRSHISSIRLKTGAGSIGDVLRKVAVLPPLTSALRQCEQMPELAHVA